MVEQTLVLIKPDGLSKSLTGNVLTRLSETKLEIVASRIVEVSKELADKIKDGKSVTAVFSYPGAADATLTIGR